MRFIHDDTFSSNLITGWYYSILLCHYLFIFLLIYARLFPILKLIKNTPVNFEILVSSCMCMSVLKVNTGSRIAGLSFVLHFSLTRDYQVVLNVRIASSPSPSRGCVAVCCLNTCLYQTLKFTEFLCLKFLLVSHYAK